MSFQICLCGTQPGYTHVEDCPYPMYHQRSEAMILRWTEARNNLREALKMNDDAITHENEHPYPNGWGEPKGHGVNDE